MTDSLKDTIIPKSDQLNADDLLVGPITVTVESVKRGPTKEQPVVIGISGGHQPYKPCKSMRRVLIAAWGDSGAEWVGKSMTLYCDPTVQFGGVKVGGIRISHLSHIDSDRAMLLTATRGKRSEFLVRRLIASDPVPGIIASFDGLNESSTESDYQTVRERCKGLTAAQMKVIKPIAEAAKERIAKASPPAAEEQAI